jgi:peptidoglycan-N-acetylglucosamine deacetylase
MRGDKALRLGWISLPYAFLFNVVMPVSALLLNIFIIFGITVGVLHPGFWVLVAFTLVDIFYAYIAFLDEPKKTRRFVALVPLQRFAYLFVYSAIILLVVIKVLDGSPTRWNKLKRTGSAEKFFNERFGGPGIMPTPTSG